MEKIEKTVLIVEDDPSLREMLKKKFEEKGYRVEEAENGEKAIEKAKEIVPNIILLDVILPKKDGYEVIREIRADKSVSNMPILLLTNLESSADVDKALRLGVTNYLVKSDYTLEEVVEKVREMLERKK